MPLGTGVSRMNKKTRTAHIVGAGIAGLATAIGLANRGWSVRVFERSPVLRTTGGGIGLTPNGLHALNALGVGESVRRCSVVQEEGGVRAPSGRFIARSRLEFVERRYGESIRSLLRTDLAQALEAALPEGTVRYGARVEDIRPGDAATPAELIVAGESLTSDLVVGADGIRSAVRRCLYPDHPPVRSCGAVSWRAVVPASGMAPVAAETWGAGLRLSILPLPGDRVHFSALACSSLWRSVRDSPDGPARLFGDWHDPIPLMLRRATHETTYFDQIEELPRPLDGFARGRVVLVGDAAHPMAPNVGVANLALEDAVELAHTVGDAGDWDALRAGLARYDRVRRPRTIRMSRMSRRMGRFAEMRAPLAVAARNGGVWLGGFLPEVVSRRFMDSMAGWTPPAARTAR
ncbi:FAD-dependent oxidoreductase [Nonomuraea terrae]|uniref:FAD-dependent oxidoreductase n=1 Tax=Nonomuraea terrae TaxID=2530383 RepID=UPI0037983C5C